jgi:uncharacterized membrane protein
MALGGVHGSDYRPRLVSTYDWLLFLHITGAFLFAGGVFVAGAFNIAAQFRERPSEIALLLGLTRFAVVVIGVGSVMTLVFGLWLVSEAPWGYGYGQAWVIAAIVLWVVGNAMGGQGGNREKATRLEAERLAEQGDAPSAELRARMRDPLTLLLSYGGAVLLLAVIALMIWKPGA